MGESHRAAAERIVELAKTSESLESRTVVGVDENLRHPELYPVLRALVSEVPFVIGTDTLWHEQRQTSEGKRLLAGGGSPVGVVKGHDWGKPIPGLSWPDARVVEHALATLYSYPRVVVLSADRRKNRDGLRSILYRDADRY